MKNWNSPITNGELVDEKHLMLSPERNQSDGFDSARGIFNAVWISLILWAIIGLILWAITYRLTTPLLRIDVRPPSHDSMTVWRGIASWYGDAYQGRTTTSGEPFDKRARTCAHPYLPFGTYLHLINVKKDRHAFCRVNDRGPFCEYPGSYWFSCKQPRIVDVSERIAEDLGFRHDGIAIISLTVVE